ncbi:MAG: hypothetical protein A3J24_02885 [Deltaproteobacteria bacterium RIFCSPLOWO2_02_FULL_53_8]|nr:MAG: hypothetical protein A3J24_02885 [Deltaproteobacteria bacterium RIFCSPLOWO2_02_FULL_53_8]
MRAPKAFLDTTVLKFSATELPRLQPRITSINWGGKNIDVTNHDFVDINPNDCITNTELKAEAELLPRLAEIGKLGAIEYVINIETEQESWGLPNMDSKTGLFYGAPIKTVKAPLEYSRVVAGGETKARERQYDFLCSIKHKRFLELQKMTGAYQGKQPLNHNQLLDAFHLWCAEHNDCEFFLTLDFTVIKVLGLSPKKSTVQAARPSQLLSILEQRTQCSHT